VVAVVVVVMVAAWASHKQWLAAEDLAIGIAQRAVICSSPETRLVGGAVSHILVALVAVVVAEEAEATLEEEDLPVAVKVVTLVKKACLAIGHAPVATTSFLPGMLRVAVVVPPSLEELVVAAKPVAYP